MSNQFDIVIIGTGAGGGILLHKLAPSGKKILLIEKDGFIPKDKEKENWDTEEVFINGRYKTKDEWYDSKGKAFHPGQHYCVGGNTKMYGAALFRLREKDFEELKYHGGTSPAWPIKYADLKEYYQEAEELYHVNGQRNSDPTEPLEEKPYPHNPLPHEPRIQKLYDNLKTYGLHPFPLPVGLIKQDGIQEAPLVLDRFEDATGKKVTDIIVDKDSKAITVTAETFFLCAGAIQTPINTEALKELNKLIPYKQIGNPNDIGSTAAWLASDESDYINGSTIFVDGGMTCYPGFTTNG